MTSSFSKSPKRPFSSSPGEITEVRTERTVYSWKIRKFQFLSQSPGEPIHSKTFYSEKSAEKWRLLFYPNGYSSTDRHYIAVYISRETAVKRKIQISYELTILQSDQVRKKLRTTQEFDSTSDWGYPRFLKRSHLLSADSANSSNSSNSADKNEFTIRCVIEVPFKTVTSSFDAEISPPRTRKMGDDIQRLLKRPKYSDLTILVGKESFPTHKNILASRSTVFAAMFEEKEGGSELEEIEINDFSPRIVQAILDFIYSDRVSGIEDIAINLLIAADTYKVEGLKDECTEAIYKIFNKHNAADILGIAEKHGAPKLKEYALKYMADNFLDVVESEIYQSSKLSTKLLREFIHARAQKEKNL